MGTTYDHAGNWRAGLLLGLLSSTFSTLVITLGAGRIGRDPAVDWMQVGMAYFGRKILAIEPSWEAIGAGILVHQSADIFWAVVFFGVLWGWTHSLSPLLILAVGIPWAILSSAIEYFLVLPWLQPWLPMQVPYWTALAVHLTSSAVYPLFPLIRQWLIYQPVAGARFARWWALVLTIGLLGMGSLWTLGASGKEMRWPFATIQVTDPDGQWLRHMTAHHVVGLQLAQLAAERSEAAAVRDLAVLMAAEHKAEIARMRLWWRSWFDHEMPGISDQEYLDMVGMPPPELLEHLQTIEGKDFERTFLPVMLRHHEGAIVMCNAMGQQRRDPRIALLAVSISHAQKKQMEQMRQMLRQYSNDGSAAIPYVW